MNPTDVTQFHNDLKAAIIARAPLEIGETSGRATGRLTLKKLGDLETSVQSRFSTREGAGTDVDSAPNTNSLNGDRFGFGIARSLSRGASDV